MIKPGEILIVDGPPSTDKKLTAELRKLRDLGGTLMVKGNELMKLGVEVQRLVDSVGLRVNAPMVVPAEIKLPQWEE